MIRTLYVIVALGLGCFLARLSTYITPNWLVILLATFALFILTAALVVALVRGWLSWRRESRYWSLPGLSCLAFLLVAWFVAPLLGRQLADGAFKRQLREYNGAISQIEGANIPIAPTLAAVQVDHPPRQIKTILAARCPDGGIVAAFLLDADVPLVHEGYVYEGYEQSNSCPSGNARAENKWPYLRHITGPWYHFSDQPGL